MIFDEETIQKIFGSEAAEDEKIERLKAYYFKNDVYEKIHNNLPLRILVGHKGIGKSATFKISYEENKSKNNIAIWIRPDDIMEICQTNNNLLTMIRDWKNGLSNIIFQKVLESVGINDGNKYDNYINLAGKLISTLKTTFQNKIKNTVSMDALNEKIINTYLSKKRYLFI